MRGEVDETGNYNRDEEMKYSGVIRRNKVEEEKKQPVVEPKKRFTCRNADLAIGNL